MAEDFQPPKRRASRDWRLPEIRDRRLLVPGGIAAAVLLYLGLVWPTPWEYSGDDQRRRTHRLTGREQVFDRKQEEWRDVRGGRGKREDRVGGRDRGGRGGRDAERNSSATSGGGSPVGGSRSGGGPRDDGADRWWWQDGKRTRDESPRGEGSPVGGGDRGRGGREGGSPIGGGPSGGGSREVEPRHPGPRESQSSPVGRSSRAETRAEEPGEAPRAEAEEDPFWRD